MAAIGGVLASRPLIFPSSVRLLRPEEVPEGADHESLVAKVAKAQTIPFTVGYTLRETRRREFAAYAEVNADAPDPWSLVRGLTNGLLPERAALLIGVKDERPHSCPYRAKDDLMQAVEPYGGALARDGFVQFGFIWQLDGVTDEIFVEPARYLKVWTTKQEALQSILSQHHIPRASELAFLDEYPRVTEVTYHPPEMYTYRELIERVLAADARLPGPEGAA